MNHKDYIERERYHLSYLNVLAKLNSDYYIQYNGVIDDVQKIAGRIE